MSETTKVISQGTPSHLAPHLWQKGVSGNPKGRPKRETQVKALAREHSMEAMEKLVAIMRTSKDEKLQRLAALDILAYGIGKPRETSETPDTEEHQGFSDDELAQLLE